VLFGGLTLTTDHGEVAVNNETWLLDGSRWTQVMTPGPIPPRWNAMMASIDGAVVMFGGTSYGDYFAYDDTWAFDGSTWTQITGAAPPGRFSAGMTSYAGGVLLYGGTNGQTYDPVLTDTWTFDGTTWTQLAIDAGSSPPARASTAMAALQ